MRYIYAALLLSVVASARAGRDLKQTAFNFGGHQPASGFTSESFRRAVENAKQAIPGWITQSFGHSSGYSTQAPYMTTSSRPQSFAAHASANTNEASGFAPASSKPTTSRSWPSRSQGTSTTELPTNYQAEIPASTSSERMALPSSSQPDTASGTMNTNLTPTASGASSGCPDMQSVLDKHNQYRAAHGAAPLVWSDSIAATAQAWSDRCVFQHSRNGYGENLAMGTSSCGQAVDLWYAERSSYAGSFSSQSGHFSQVVWKGSQELGCGYNAGCKIITCNYNPPGNMMGQFAQNVQP